MSTVKYKHFLPCSTYVAHGSRNEGASYVQKDLGTNPYIRVNVEYCELERNVNYLVGPRTADRA